MAGLWNQTIFKVPQHPNHSVIPNPSAARGKATTPWQNIAVHSFSSAASMINTSRPATGISWRKSSDLSPELGPHWAPRNSLNAPSELWWGLPFFSFFNQRVSPSETATGTFRVEPEVAAAAAAFIAEAEKELCLLSWDLHRNQGGLSKKRKQKRWFSLL